MNEKLAASKGTWAFMAVLVLAAVAFAILKARPKWERAASAKCRAKLETIAGLLGAYKGSHQGQFPADLSGLDSMVRSRDPLRWMCPSDKEHSSYEFAFPEGKEYKKSDVFVRCRTHGHVCLADGSVIAFKPESK